MSQFRRYDHVERLGHRAVAGLVYGTVHVFPKLDGSNGSVWSDGTGTVWAGNRNRVLSVEKDNHGFCAWLNTDDAHLLRSVVTRFPNLIIYGEWLVPHSLKTYRDEAWRRFWVFDVYDLETKRYMEWELYAPLLAGLDLIHPMAIIQNPTIAQLQEWCDKNTYLLQDGAGLGEGVVLKNYQWKNDSYEQPWAKIVRNDFKEKNLAVFGAPKVDGAFEIESAITQEFCTPHLVSKTRAKVVSSIANEEGIDLSAEGASEMVAMSYRAKVIPQLLGRVYHDLVEEEIWSILKKHRNPIIDFKKLHEQVVAKTKALAADLF